MGDKKLRGRSVDFWDLVRDQHGVVSRTQLMTLGFSSKAIAHRIDTGRLHPLWRGVYAVGRPDLGRRGWWMAAVLSCGPHAMLSHRSAAALWSLLGETNALEVVVPGEVLRRRPGIAVHRRAGLQAADRRLVHQIPVTDPVATLVDLASCVPERQLERAINEADRLDLTDPEKLRAAIDSLSRRPGLASVRRLLDRQTFTDSGLERRFLPLARAAGLPPPMTQAWVRGFRVDFFWPQLGLVVEADGLRYHRTPGQQASDRRRDQVHVAAGLTTLRFAQAQIRFEPDRVRAILTAVAARLSRGR